MVDGRRRKIHLTMVDSFKFIVSKLVCSQLSIWGSFAEDIPIEPHQPNCQTNCECYNALAVRIFLM